MFSPAGLLRVGSTVGTHCCFAGLWVSAILLIRKAYSNAVSYSTRGLLVDRAKGLFWSILSLSLCILTMYSSALIFKESNEDLEWFKLDKTVWPLTLLQSSLGKITLEMLWMSVISQSLKSKAMFLVFFAFGQ